MSKEPRRHREPPVARVGVPIADERGTSAELYDQVVVPVVLVKDLGFPSLQFNASAKAFFGIGEDDERFYIKEYYKHLNRDDLEAGFGALARGETATVRLVLRDGEGAWHAARLLARPEPPGRPNAVGAVITVALDEAASDATPARAGANPATGGLPLESLAAIQRLTKLLWDDASIGLSVSPDFPEVPPVWNDALYELLGYRSGGVSPSTKLSLDHVHPEDRPRVTTLHERLAAGQPEAWQADYRIVSLTGETTWVNARGLVGHDDEGRLVMANVVAPVSDRRSAAYATNTARAELDRLVYTISHDLRAPARQAKAFVELLLETLAERLNEDEQVLAQYALSSTERLVEMIEGIVHISRIGNELTEPRGVRLERVARSIVESDFAEASGRIVLRDLPEVYGHPLLLRRLLYNLIDNAVKFSRESPGSPIEIVGGVGENGLASVTVTDHGVGFDPRLTPKLFQVFRRFHATDEFEGLGLGLAEARRIADLHGGTLSAVSEVDQGVAVTLTLPLPPEH